MKIKEIKKNGEEKMEKVTADVCVRVGKYFNDVECGKGAIDFKFASREEMIERLDESDWEVHETKKLKVKCEEIELEVGTVDVVYSDYARISLYLINEEAANVIEGAMGYKNESIIFTVEHENSLTIFPSVSGGVEVPRNGGLKVQPLNTT
ncbi:hypothetical protein [Desulfopila sp. IMCC35008]|uniref:hypothetical protein n=1 Tax=Desulfopila sp. IMCC35008 TaxID=2653858 RepID=UPI0013D561D2|nr:hypothetical protein [Desulfopila sp. IMCC35008]